MKKKLILGSALAIMMSASMIAGATYAIFTSEADTNVSIETGTLKVTSTVTPESVKHFSRGLLIGDHFANGGKATLLEDGSLKLENVTPGDRIEFAIHVTNTSTVKAKYRVRVNCESGFDLYNALVTRTNGSASWTDLAPETAEFDTVATIELPESFGNEYQGLITNLKVTIEAVQANADVTSNEFIKLPVTGNASEPITVPVDGVEPVKGKTVNGIGSIKVDRSVIRDTGKNIEFSVEEDNDASDIDKLIANNGAGKDYHGYKFKASNIKVTAPVGRAVVEAVPLELQMYVGKGFKSSICVYDNKGVELTSSEFRKSKDYNDETGLLTIRPSHFYMYETYYVGVDNALKELDATEVGVRKESGNIVVLTKTELQNTLNNAKTFVLPGDLYFGADTTNNDAQYLVPSMTITNENLLIDLNGYSIRFEEGIISTFNTVNAFMTLDGNANVVIDNLKAYSKAYVDTTVGKNTAYGFNLNSATATLTVRDGIFKGQPTAFQVSHGTLNVEGGDFRLTENVIADDPTLAKYIINCIDASWTDGSAKINVTGGIFRGTDPANNPEGDNTSYVATGYKSQLMYGQSDIYEVVKA